MKIISVQLLAVSIIFIGNTFSPVSDAHAQLCLFRDQHKDCADNGCKKAGGTCRRDRMWVDHNDNGKVDPGETVDSDTCSCVGGTCADAEEVARALGVEEAAR